MPRPGDAGRGSTLESETKGTILRGRIDALRRMGRLSQVVEHLDPPARRAVTSPPLTSTWIDSRLCFEIDAVVYDLFGAAVTRQYGADSAQPIAGVLRRAVEGALRLFTVSPATLLSRMGQLTGSTSRGLDYAYAAETKASGVLTLRYLQGHGCPYATWLGNAGGLRVVFDFTGVESGSISDPHVEPNGLENTARYRLRW